MKTRTKTYQDLCADMLGIDRLQLDIALKNYKEYGGGSTLRNLCELGIPIISEEKTQITGTTFPKSYQEINEWVQSMGESYYNYLKHSNMYQLRNCHKRLQHAIERLLKYIVK